MKFLFSSNDLKSDVLLSAQYLIVKNTDVNMFNLLKTL